MTSQVNFSSMKSNPGVFFLSCTNFPKKVFEMKSTNLNLFFLFHAIFPLKDLQEVSRILFELLYEVILKFKNDIFKQFFPLEKNENNVQKSKTSITSKHNQTHEINFNYSCYFWGYKPIHFPLEYTYSEFLNFNLLLHHTITIPTHTQSYLMVFLNPGQQWQPQK